MFDKIKNIFKSDKEENNVTPKNAPKEVTVPAHKIGPKSQDDTTTYVIIGASIAGVTAVKTLRELDKSAKIIVISKDENIYSRCMLHHLEYMTKCIFRWFTIILYTISKIQHLKPQVFHFFLF